MARLHIYTVHTKPDMVRSYEEAEFVEEGFSWYPFVFVWMWALYHRLWLIAPVLMVCSGFIFVAGLQQWLNPVSLMAISMGFRLIVGFYGNDWVRGRLKRQGYIIADIVSGDNKLRAEQRFFDRYAAHTQAPAAPAQPFLLPQRL